MDTFCVVGCAVGCAAGTRECNNALGNARKIKFTAKPTILSPLLSFKYAFPFPETVALYVTTPSAETVMSLGETTTSAPLFASVSFETNYTLFSYICQVTLSQNASIFEKRVQPVRKKHQKNK